MLELLYGAIAWQCIDQIHYIIEVLGPLAKQQSKLDRVTFQHSNQLHLGHISAGNNQLHAASSNNWEYHYLVFCTYDKPPCHMTTTTQIALHHTSRFHYFHKT
jgi:hypothetical protein